MDVNIRVPAIDKLIDIAASGIGSVAGYLSASRVARREVETKLIAAEGEVQAQRILAEGQATALQIIANAQANARSILVSPDSTVRGQLEFAKGITQRIQFQEEKRQANIVSVVTQAALELGDTEVQNHEVDHDWTARFFNDVQDVSSEEMQKLWAKVLAGEVERTGSTSIKTLGVLKNLDRATATLFGKLCSICVSIRPDGISFNDARVPFPDDYLEGNALRDYGLDFGNLNMLNEHGLINPEYNTWHDYHASIGLDILQSQTIVRIPFYFQGKYWVLVPASTSVQREEFKLSGIALTRSGQELSRVVDLVPAEQYALRLVEYFRNKNLQMTEVASWKPQVISSSSP